MFHALQLSGVSTSGEAGNAFAPSLSNGVKSHVKKYARRKVVVGNSLMIRDGIGLHAVTGNVRAYGGNVGAQERGRSEIL